MTDQTPPSPDGVEACFAGGSKPLTLEECNGSFARFLSRMHEWECKRAGLIERLILIDPEFRKQIIDKGYGEHVLENGGIPHVWPGYEDCPLPFAERSEGEANERPPVVLKGVFLQTGTVHRSRREFVAVIIDAAPDSREWIAEGVQDVLGNGACCKQENDSGEGRTLILYRADDWLGNWPDTSVSFIDENGKKGEIRIIADEGFVGIFGTSPLYPFSRVTKEAADEPHTCKWDGDEISHADDLCSVSEADIPHHMDELCEVLKQSGCTHVEKTCAEWRDGQPDAAEARMQAKAVTENEVLRTRNAALEKANTELKMVVGGYGEHDPIKEAQKQTTEAQVAKDAARIATLRTPFVLRDASTIPPREWLYGKHYIRKYLTCTAGAGGMGKSFLSLVEALAMSTGKDLIGHRPRKPLRVLYLNGEDPSDELERRVAAICKHYGIGQEDIGDRLFINSGRTVPITIAVDERNGTRVCEPDLNVLRQVIRECAIDVVILDPFVSFHEVPESDNTKLKIICKQLAAIAEELNCGVEIVHHVRKSQQGQSEITAEDARGGKALVDAARSVRVLNRMAKDLAKRHGIEDHRSYFHVGPDKQNLAPPVNHAGWHRIVSVPLGNEHEGMAGDHVGVVTAVCLSNAADVPEMWQVQAIQEKIASSNYREHPQAAAWAGRVVAEVLSIDIADKAGKARAKAMLDTLIQRKWLRTSLEPDGHREDKWFVRAGTPVTDGDLQESQEMAGGDEQW